MTREEEIYNAMGDAEWKHIDGTKDIELFDIGFKEGAVWADRTMIEKACEWLDYHLTFNVAEWDEGYTTQRVVDKFRKAMQEGEE